MSEILLLITSFLLFLCSFDTVLERYSSWYCLLFAAGIWPRHGRISYPVIFDTCTSALVAFVERKGFGVDKSFCRGHQPHVHPAYDLLLSSNPVILLIIGQSQMLKRAGRGCSSLIGSVALAPAAANPAAPTRSVPSGDDDGGNVHP